MTEEFIMEYYKNHDDNEYTLLGTLELFDNHEKKAKSVIVEQYLREGWQKPHIHLYNNEIGFSCAIRLDINSYFIHGKYQDKLTDKQAKLFDEFMREKIKSSDETKWNYARLTFNLEFPGHPITIKKQPNYTLLNYTK